MYNSQNLPYYGPFVKQVKPTIQAIKPAPLMVIGPDDDELRAIVHSQAMESVALLKAQRQTAIEQLDGLWAEYLTV